MEWKNAKYLNYCCDREPDNELWWNFFLADYDRPHKFYTIWQEKDAYPDVKGDA